MPRIGGYIRASGVLFIVLSITVGLLWHGPANSTLPMWAQVLAAFSLACMLAVHMALLTHVLALRSRHDRREASLTTEPITPKAHLPS